MPESLLDTPLTRATGIEVPLICGAMYPCSNPELVAAVSAAGGMGIVQPLSMVYVHRHGFREGMRLIRSITDHPVGLNVIVEKSVKKYQGRMMEYVDQSIEEGVRFFVTSLGNPDWVVEKAHAVGGLVYHDVTERKWAQKGLEAGIDGLIAVNRRAGGHAGEQGEAELLDELGDLGVPVVCAGGIGDEADFVRVMRLGYAGVQMGTRFIATTECNSPASYKKAVVDAVEDDIVHTVRLTGVPVAVINTPHVQRIGTDAGPIARWMLRGRKTKHWMRMIYSLRSLWSLKKSVTKKGYSSKDFWQAGKSVAGIHRVEPAGDVVRRFADAARDAP